MPYIKQERRDGLDAGAPPQSPGELNYCIARLCMEYIGSPESPVSYWQLNEIMGVLECSKQEFYRRVVAPYEDRKELENGNVY